MTTRQAEAIKLVRLRVRCTLARQWAAMHNGFEAVDSVSKFAHLAAAGKAGAKFGLQGRME